MLRWKSVSAVFLCIFLIFMLAEVQSQVEMVPQETGHEARIVRAPLRSSCPVGQTPVRGKCRTAFGVSSDLTNSP